MLPERRHLAWLCCAWATACAPSIPVPEDGTSKTGTTDDGTTDSTDDGTTGSTVPGPVETYRLYINELMASNTTVAVDPDDAEATPDWLELHNPSEVDVDLTGFTITDDLDIIDQHELDGLVLPAGGYLVLLADDTEGGIHLPFKLSSEADELGLFDPEGTPVDRIQFADLADDQVAGRYPDDGPLAILTEPTPGATNDTADVRAP